MVVLLASALKLLGVGTTLVGGIAGVLTLVGVAYAVRTSQRLARQRLGLVASVTPAQVLPALGESRAAGQ